MKRESKAYILRSDGSREDLPGRPNLAAAQKAVDGYIEDVTRLCPQRFGKTVYANEDGRPLKLPKNHRASAYFGIELVGDVLVLEGWRTLAPR